MALQSRDATFDASLTRLRSTPGTTTCRNHQALPGPHGQPVFFTESLAAAWVFDVRVVGRPLY